jgi:UDP-3-O-[3-hydroxymyristoyl] glucosamine N-acyltransferase
MLIHCNNKPIRIIGRGFVAKELKLFLQQEMHQVSFIDYTKLTCDENINQYQYLIGIADNMTLRAEIAQWLSNNNLDLCSWIHNSSYVATDAKLGKGVICYPFSLTLSAEIENHCFIGPYCHVGHGAIAGLGSVLLPYARMLGSSKLDQFCQLQSGATLLDKKHILTPFVTVLAGATVTKNIVVAGNYGGYPARKTITQI